MEPSVPPYITNQEPDNDAVLMNWIEEMPFTFMTDLDSSHVLANTLSHITTKVPPRLPNARALDFLLDTAAGRHLCCLPWLLTEYKPFPKPIPMNGVGTGAYAQGCGNLPLVVQRENHTATIVLKDTCMAPKSPSSTERTVACYFRDSLTAASDDCPTPSQSPSHSGQTHQATSSTKAWVSSSPNRQRTQSLFRHFASEWVT